MRRRWTRAGGLDATDLHWIRAFAARKQRRVGQPPRQFPVYYGDVLITLAHSALPYGRTTGGRGWLTHIVDEVYLFWRRGQVIGSAVRWRCGATSSMFRFVAEPDSTLCVVCPIERPTRERP